MNGTGLEGRAASIAGLPAQDRDLEQAHAYLDALGETFSFQTFSDRQELKLKRDGKLVDPNALILHGSLDEHGDTLLSLNRRGGGIFVMINAGDGRGRTAKNVTAVRGLFVDLDGAPLPARWELHPHILVQSSQGRYHAYWMTADLPPTEFGKVQKALAAHHGSDASVTDLSRVLRLPGFVNHKRSPELVRLLEVNHHHHYTRAEVLAAWPTVAEALRPPRPPRPRPATPPTGMTERILEAALSRYSSPGTRHEGAKWIACQALWNGLEEGEAEALAHRYSAAVTAGDFDVNEALEVVAWAYRARPPGEPWSFNELSCSSNQSPWARQKPDLMNKNPDPHRWTKKSPWETDRAG